MADIRLNLVVIRSTDSERAVQFYSLLGLMFTKHRHGGGPEHYASETNGFVFEVYPRQNDADSTTATRLGFQVAEVDSLVERLKATGAKVISVPRDSQWGRRAVVEDPDGHRIELVSQAQGG